jgi:hypothetical protein
MVHRDGMRDAVRLAPLVVHQHHDGSQRFKRGSTKGEKEGSRGWNKI